MLGLLGGGMRYLGVAASTEVTVFLAFITGIILLLALFSGRLRRKISVLIRKNFFRHKYDYRTEWLRYTESLASCNSLHEVRHKILAVYAETFGLKGASLFMRREEGNVFYPVAWQGSAYHKNAELRASDRLINYFNGKERVYNPADGEHEPTDEEKSFVEQYGAGLMVPLNVNDAVAGIIVFGGQLSRETYIYEDYDLMKTLAREASLTLANFQLSEELAETREVAAVARISSFVIHDLKNHTSSLSMMLGNAAEHIDNPEFQQDMLRTLKGTVARMRELIQKLRNLPEKQSLQTSPVELRTLAAAEVESLKKFTPELDLACGGVDVVAVADREEMRKVILNLLLNACEATDGKGVVRIETGRNGNAARIRVVDDGCGMHPEFVENHLFKPFRTTKKKGLGIGLYQCRQIVEDHGGRIEVQSSPQKGTAFTVRLPLAQPMISPAG
jgi:putative PEP-CTERM system histidine kinase